MNKYQIIETGKSVNDSSKEKRVENIPVLDKDTARQIAMELNRFCATNRTYVAVPVGYEPRDTVYPVIND